MIRKIFIATLFLSICVISSEVSASVLDQDQMFLDPSGDIGRFIWHLFLTIVGVTGVGMWITYEILKAIKFDHIANKIAEVGLFAGMILGTLFVSIAAISGGIYNLYTQEYMKEYVPPINFVFGIVMLLMVMAGAAGIYWVFSSTWEVIKESKKSKENNQKKQIEKIVNEPEMENTSINSEHAETNKMDAKTHREKKIIDRLSKELGREPTPEEVEKAKWTY